MIVITIKDFSQRDVNAEASETCEKTPTLLAKHAEVHCRPFICDPPCDQSAFF